MANLEQSFDTRFSLQFAPTSFLMRLGRREIFVCRDFRQRSYYVNPMMDCSTGVQAGHLEILLFHRHLGRCFPAIKFHLRLLHVAGLEGFHRSSS